MSLPIVKDAETVLRLMPILVKEMNERGNLPDEKKLLLPAIVVVVDEYLNLINSLDGKDKDVLSNAILNLLRSGRQSKIHVVLATQEATKDDMGISIRNVSARVAFMCTDNYHSEAVLGKGAIGRADKLSGKGAMLFRPPGQDTAIPLQGSFMLTEEMEQMVARIASAQHDFSNKFVITEEDLAQPPISPPDASPRKVSSLDEKRELAMVIMWVVGREDVSGLQIMKQFNMGNRAYDIVDELYKMNIVTAKKTEKDNNPRTVIPQCIENLSTEIVDFLGQYGYTAEQVAAAFGYKQAEEADFDVDQPVNESDQADDDTVAD